MKVSQTTVLASSGITATSALLHPNPVVARSNIFTAINDARIRLNVTEQELADDLGLPDLSFLRNSDKAGKVKLSDILGLSAVLGVSHDRVLPLAPFTKETKVYWLAQMAAKNAGPIAPADGVDLEEDVAISLFVRFQALTELFPQD